MIDEGKPTAGQPPATHPPTPDAATALDPVPMETVAPPSRRGRAGRDVPVAIAVGLALAGLVLLSLFVWKAAFVVVVVAAIVLGLGELGNGLAAAGIRLPRTPVALGAVAMLVSAYLGGAESLLVAFAVTVGAVLVWRLTDASHGQARDISAGIFASLYVPFLAGFAMLLLRPEDGPQRVVAFILLTVLSDVGGFAAGVLLGRHPMAPSVSPKKSWEGFAGSAVFCAAGGAAVLVLMLGGAFWQGVLLGLAVACTATLGDLGESMIKRDLDIKDMGTLLPGHGGLMDRLDSLLPVAPVVYLVLSAFLPT